jgi:hypothetical protein
MSAPGNGRIERAWCVATFTTATNTTHVQFAEGTTPQAREDALKWFGSTSNISVVVDADVVRRDGDGRPWDLAPPDGIYREVLDTSGLTLRS